MAPSSGPGKRRGSCTKHTFIFLIGLTAGFAIAAFYFDPMVPQRAYVALRRVQAVDTIYYQSNQAQLDVFPPEVLSPSMALGLRHNVDLNSSFAYELLKGVQEVSARRLAKEVRILCWVMTMPDNHEVKAWPVKATWGRHCNKLLFFSEGADESLPTVKLNVRSGRKGLWAKTVEAFKYIQDHHFREYDWVVKADDDTYVIVENLRHMLLPYNPNEPHYFGFQYKPHTPYGYVSGGAGYVLSKMAVQKLVLEAFDKQKHCPSAKSPGAEDVNLGWCLSTVGIKAGDSRDPTGRNRFFPFDIEDHVNPLQIKRGWWYTEYRYWPIKGGLKCCSDKPVSFHYVTPSKMYMLEYLIYHVEVFPVMHLVTAKPIMREKTAKPGDAEGAALLSLLPARSTEPEPREPEDEQYDGISLPPEKPEEPQPPAPAQQGPAPANSKKKPKIDTKDEKMMAKLFDMLYKSTENPPASPK